MTKITLIRGAHLLIHSLKPVWVRLEMCLTSQTLVNSLNTLSRLACKVMQASEMISMMHTIRSGALRAMELTVNQIIASLSRAISAVLFLSLLISNNLTLLCKAIKKLWRSKFNKQMTAQVAIIWINVKIKTIKARCRQHTNMSLDSPPLAKANQNRGILIMGQEVQALAHRRGSLLVDCPVARAQKRQNSQLSEMNPLKRWLILTAQVKSKIKIEVLDDLILRMIRNCKKIVLAPIVPIRSQAW